MRFLFDIGNNGRISVSLVPLGEDKFGNPSQIPIEHPVRDVYRLRDDGYYDNLSDSQFQVLINRIFNIETYFNRPTTVGKLLEQLVEAFINAEVHT